MSSGALRVAELQVWGLLCLLTGTLSLLSSPQSAIQAAASASIEIQNVVEFYRQWKEMG